MANFEFAYSLLIQAEYAGKPEYFLHKNKHESDFTCGGVYQKYNPESLDWTFMKNLSNMCGYDIHRVNEIETEIDEIKERTEFLSGQSLLEANQRIDELNFQRKSFKNNLKRASKMIYADEKLRGQVANYFRANYWDNIRLSEVHSQVVANEIFLMAVVSGTKTAARLAQELVGAKADGILGSITIKCLNNYNPDMFDKQYDDFEKRHFDTIIEKNPKLSVNKKGWYNRSELV